MTDPYGVKEYLEKYGSDDAKVLAMIIHGNTELFSMSAHEGMDALRRLADLELENYTMRQLVSRGYSFTFKSDGVKVTILDGNFFLARHVLDAIYHLAGTFCPPPSEEKPITMTDTWPESLKETVKRYLESRGLVV